MKKAKKPTHREINALAKKALGEKALVDFYWGGRIFIRNEEDLSMEIESVSNAEASRLAVVVLQAIGKYRSSR